VKPSRGPAYQSEDGQAGVRRRRARELTSGYGTSEASGKPGEKSNNQAEGVSKLGDAKDIVGVTTPQGLT